VEDTFNFKKILADWQEENTGNEQKLAFELYKEKYFGDSKFANKNFIPGTIYACTRLLLPDEKGSVNPRPLLLSLGPKKQEGPRVEVVMDIAGIPYKTRALVFSILYKYYGKKLIHIAENAEAGTTANKIAIQLSSKEAGMIFKGIVPNNAIVSVPREALVKIHPVDIGDWPVVCFMDTKGLGSSLSGVFAQFKQALGKRN